ncbi:hypothetical protein [Yinghuangia soli]|uniref:Uncharacterized protein n=1 Tax=Yinghuangia soli TaxID=2908204 RepID=A0AA41Q6U2_9ACTN|nr:hypothetical protein [Yinghuangia soli]MCF2532553.1 hypothetical protein [Yinghuangia soli]
MDLPSSPDAARPGGSGPGALGAVSLGKGGQATIAFDKSDADVTVTATLEWDGGSSERRDKGADLDLYALYVAADDVAGDLDRIGSKRTIGRLPHELEDLSYDALKNPRAGAVYWNHLGAADRAPYIALDGDAQVPGVETVRITRPDRQGFVLICAYSAVGNGVGSFKSYGARAVVADGRGSTVTAPLYEANETAYWVAIALIDFTAPDGIVLTHVEAYSESHSENRPMLYPDGTFAMDLGPVEFKAGPAGS